MALDKQKILSDLGNVMNQLQGADCGCMGKIFSKPAPVSHGIGMGAPCGGYNYGCCQGHRYACAGEPYSMNTHGMNRPCMGQCNPAKLYGDTYGYLNQNLMKPVVKEVYDDLKSLCPANTVMNSVLGNQMGLAPENTSKPVVTGNFGEAMVQNPMSAGAMHNTTPGTGAMGTASIENNQQQMNPMGGGMSGGMGAHIVNMMMGNDKAKSMDMSGQNNQKQPQAVSYMNPHVEAHNSGNIDANQMQYQASNMQGNQIQHNVGDGTMPYTTQGNAMPQLKMQTPVNQFMPNSQGNVMPSNMAYNNMDLNAQTSNVNRNPPNQQITAAQRHNYGQHSQGISQFNKMFPGVMQGMDGSLDFDPMTIAIQMNPANKQQATMNTMQKLMSNNNQGINKAYEAGNPALMQPVLNGANAVAAAFAPAQVVTNQAPSTPTDQVINHQIPINHQMSLKEQQIVNDPGTMQQNQLQQQQQQQVYALESPTMNQFGTELSHQQQFQRQEPIDTNVSSHQRTINLPVGGYPNQIPATPLSHQNLKESIYPVDTSKYQTTNTKHQQNLQYNTLGQPVEMLPAKNYHQPESILPQTLSPQPSPTKHKAEPMKYSNVKSTVSKTSLFAKMPNKMLSRSRLQNVYNQYPGSHSFSQQNVKAPVENHGISYSDRRLNVSQANAKPFQQVPIERVGGDTLANIQVNNERVPFKQEQPIEQVGDVPVSDNPRGNVALVKPGDPVKHARLRNGLQDMVYTSYPQSAAWTFHGHTPFCRQPLPSSVGFRNFRKL